MAPSRNRKGFAIAWVLVFVAVASAALGAVMEAYISVQNKVAEAELRLQASNFASEGLELFRGWAATARNKDSAEGWNKAVTPVSGACVVRYDRSSGYSLSHEDHEDLSGPGERDVTFRRTVTVSDGTVPGSKNVTSSVSWGGTLTVQYEMTLTDA